MADTPILIDISEKMTVEDCAKNGVISFNPQIAAALVSDEKVSATFYKNFKGHMSTFFADEKDAYAIFKNYSACFRDENNNRLSDEERNKNFAAVLEQLKAAYAANKAEYNETTDEAARHTNALNSFALTAVAQYIRAATHEMAPRISEQAGAIVEERLRTLHLQRDLAAQKQAAEVKPEEKKEDEKAAKTEETAEEKTKRITGSAIAAGVVTTALVWGAKTGLQAITGAVLPAIFTYKTASSIYKKEIEKAFAWGAAALVSIGATLYVADRGLVSVSGLGYDSIYNGKVSSRFTPNVPMPDLKPGDAVLINRDSGVYLTTDTRHTSSGEIGFASRQTLACVRGLHKGTGGYVDLVAADPASLSSYVTLTIPGVHPHSNVVFQVHAGNLSKPERGPNGGPFQGTFGDPTKIIDCAAVLRSAEVPRGLKADPLPDYITNPAATAIRPAASGAAPVTPTYTVR